MFYFFLSFSFGFINIVELDRKKLRLPPKKFLEVAAFVKKFTRMVNVPVRTPFGIR